jgi:hypothetical protein
MQVNYVFCTKNLHMDRINPLTTSKEIIDYILEFFF